MNQVSSGLIINSNAATELLRQSAFGGSPGEMHIDLLGDSCSEGWLHIRLRVGQNKGVPLARTEGLTLFAPLDQLEIFKGLTLSFFADLSGGGFLISTPESAEGCACGAGFRLAKIIEN